MEPILGTYSTFAACKRRAKEHGFVAFGLEDPNVRLEQSTGRAHCVMLLGRPSTGQVLDHECEMSILKNSTARQYGRIRLGGARRLAVYSVGDQDYGSSSITSCQACVIIARSEVHDSIPRGTQNMRLQRDSLREGLTIA